MGEKLGKTTDHPVAHAPGLSDVCPVSSVVRPARAIRDTRYEIRFTLMLFQPMQRHYRKVQGIDFAVTVYVAGGNGLAGRLAEVRFACLGRAAVGAHVDNPAVGEWLGADRSHRVSGINTWTRHIVYRPSPLVRIPPPGLGFEM